MISQSILLHNSKGFTLVELMVVIAIIATLISAGFFPFSYYMERARVEKNIDTFSQEWISLHEDIRNGLLHDPSGNPNAQHAHMYVTMKRGDSFITLETGTGLTSTRNIYKKIELDKPLQILGFSGSANGATTVMYHLSPPFATGAYRIDGSPEAVISTGIILKIGYPSATLISGRAREILIRPRYD